MSNDNEKKNVKGIKMQTLNYVMIVVAFIAFVAVIVETVRMQTLYNDMTDATERYINCVEYAEKFSDASDHISECVRMYVITGEKSYIDEYFNEIDVAKRCEAALDQMVDTGADDLAMEQLQHAKDKDDRLMDRELYVIRLAAEGKGDDISQMDSRIRDVELVPADAELSDDKKVSEALNIIFTGVYQSEKQAIGEYIDRFIDRQVSVINEQKQNSSEQLSISIKLQLIFISFLFVLNVAIFFLIIQLIIRPLKIYMNCIQGGKMLDIAGAYEFKYLALTYNSIYEINTANEQMLKHKAEHDSLTGLVNRGAFDQFTHMQRSINSNIALLIVDADKFKGINDTYGHSAGDAVQQQIAKLLKVHFRSTDCIARVGGDEFCVVMLDVDEDSKENISRKITSINELLKEPGDESIPPTSVSVGIAFSDCGYTDDLYAKADTALYHVKEHNRGTFAFYDESMPIKSEV